MNLLRYKKEFNYSWTVKLIAKRIWKLCSWRRIKQSWKSSWSKFTFFLKPCLSQMWTKSPRNRAILSDWIGLWRTAAIKFNLLKTSLVELRLAKVMVVTKFWVRYWKFSLTTWLQEKNWMITFRACWCKLAKNRKISSMILSLSTTNQLRKREKRRLKMIEFISS